MQGRIENEAESILEGVVKAVVCTAFSAMLICWLWNRLMPDLFGLPTITYWQAYGLGILAALLF